MFRIGKRDYTKRAVVAFKLETSGIIFVLMSFQIEDVGSKVDFEGASPECFIQFLTPAG